MKTSKKLNLILVGICMALAAVLLWGIKPAFADDNNVTTVNSTDDSEYDEYKLAAPGPGENLTVIVKEPEKQVDPPAPAPITNVTNVVKVVSRLHLRGGFTAGMMAMTEEKETFNAGLIGEIGTSALRVQGTFRVGDYKDGVSLNGGLAAMVVDKHFRSGLGVDLLYESDLLNLSGEVAKERLVGLSLHLGYIVHSHLVVDGFLGAGVVTTQIPNGRQTQPAVYGGLSLSYLWGR
jgi:hypothetical protein